MKKVFFALFIALAVIGCKKDEKGGDTPTGDDFYFRNGNDGVLDLAINGYEPISIEGATLSQLNIYSSDDEIVFVEDGVMYGIAEGTAIVTAEMKSDPTKIAVLTVNVIDLIKAQTFCDIVTMMPDTTFQDKDYTLIRKRGYRGDEIPDGGDANLIENWEHAGDTADIESWIDEVQPGQWYYLYDTLYPGETDSTRIGIFTDTVRTARMWMLSPNIFFTDDGINLTGDAVIFEWTDIYMHDFKYRYCLGDRELCDDVFTAGKQYVKTGKEAAPYPGFIQVGHFDDVNYCGYFTEVLAGNEPDWDDYPYFENYDAHYMLYYWVESEEGAYIGGREFGWPYLEGEGAVSTEPNLYFDVDYDRQTYFASYYKLPSRFLDQTMYGLALTVDEESGETVIVYPCELAETTDYTYTGQNGTKSAPSQKAVRSNREMPIRNSVARKQMSVNNTIGATLRMALTYTTNRK